MDAALKWAEDICALKSLVTPSGVPILLIEPEEVAAVVHEIDTPLVQNSDLRKLQYTQKIQREGHIADLACSRLPRVPFEPYKIVSCVLRMWSGCLGCAKTIALETRSGPNTPAQRKKIFDKKIRVLVKDPYYLVGVMAGPAFKRLRKQPYSLEGVPEEYITKYQLRN